MGFSGRGGGTGEQGETRQQTKGSNEKLDSHHGVTFLFGISLSLFGFFGQVGHITQTEVEGTSP